MIFYSKYLLCSTPRHHYWEGDQHVIVPRAADDYCCSRHLERLEYFLLSSVQKFVKYIHGRWSSYVSLSFLFNIYFAILTRFFGHCRPTSILRVYTSPSSFCTPIIFAFMRVRQISSGQLYYLSAAPPMLRGSHHTIAVNTRSVYW